MAAHATARRRMKSRRRVEARWRTPDENEAEDSSGVGGDTRQRCDAIAMRGCRVLCCEGRFDSMATEPQLSTSSRDSGDDGIWNPHNNNFFYYDYSHITTPLRVLLFCCNNIFLSCNDIFPPVHTRLALSPVTPNYLLIIALLLCLAQPPYQLPRLEIPETSLRSSSIFYFLPPWRDHRGSPSSAAPPPPPARSPRCELSRMSSSDTRSRRRWP